jgi:hypothetical protein
MTKLVRKMTETATKLVLVSRFEMVFLLGEVGALRL